MYEPKLVSTVHLHPAYQLQQKKRKLAELDTTDKNSGITLLCMLLLMAIYFILS